MQVYIAFSYKPDLSHNNLFDLSYAMEFDSLSMQIPRKAHLDDLRRTIWYIQCTLNYGLFYEANMSVRLVGYSDVTRQVTIQTGNQIIGYMLSLEAM